MSAVRSNALALALCLAGAAGITWTRRDLNQRYDRARRVLDDAQIPRPNVARVVSLGHTEWMVDVLWVNSTLYYGETLVARLPSRYVRRYAETMSALDPRFRQSYLWGALALVYRTAEVTLDDIRDAVGMLRRGLTIYPDDPELQGQLGLYLAIELSPRLAQGSDERRRVRAEAAESLRRAVSSGWGPPWMGLSTATLLMEAGRPQPALEVLRDTLSRVEEPALRANIEGRIAALIGTQPDADPLTASLRELEAARRRDVPWMPPTLYVFVGSGALDRRGEQRARRAEAASPRGDHSSTRLR